MVSIRHAKAPQGYDWPSVLAEICRAVKYGFAADEMYPVVLKDALDAIRGNARDIVPV